MTGYTYENPKLTAECSHHFHLPCILEWQQQSEECPICTRVCPSPVSTAYLISTKLHIWAS